MKKYFYVFLASFSFNLLAQDLHFSQFYSTPLMTNSANTGRIKEDYRISGIHRRQWKNINSAFLSTAISADMNFGLKILKKDKIGVGLVVYNDNLADGTIKGNAVFLSTAYHRMLDLQRRHRISFGFQAGYTSKVINDQYFQFGNQYQNYVYNASIPSTENVDKMSSQFMDIQPGIAYNYVISPKLEFFSGLSFYQLLQPKESYYSNNKTGNKLGTRYTFIPGFNYKLTDRLIISPQMMYMRQSSAHDFNAGAFFTYQLISFSKTQLIAGVFNRISDAAIFLGGIRVRNMECKISYDATLSGLRKVKGIQGTGSNDPNNKSAISTKSVNAWEISIQIYGFLPRSTPKDFTVPCGIF